MIIDLPYPPTINTYYRSWRGRVVISAKGKEYRKTVCTILAVNWKRRTFTDPVCVRITVNPPDKRRRDLDNILKSLLDALEHGGVYENDSLIEELSIKKAAPCRGGTVTVSVERKEKNV